MEELITNETIQRVRKDNCFDFLRYFFAFSLILVHFCTLTDTEQFWFISGQMRVKSFFTITGFLVVYSFIRRNNLNIYVRKRIFRIIPAYVTTIILCFLCGIFFTNVTSTEYFFSIQSLKYLVANLTFLNFIEPCLPGLFTDNPIGPFVNGSLWSMKYEVLFYIAVPFMIYLMRKYNKIYVLIPIFTLLTIYRSIYDNSINTIIYFFSGTTILLYFDWFYKNIKSIFLVCMIFYIISNIFEFQYIYYLEPFIFSSMIVGIAYFCKPLNFLQRYDNISYGLYLYHFPVIQVLINYKLHEYNIYLTFVIALLITTILAIISWYVIEKPLLRKSLE